MTDEKIQPTIFRRKEAAKMKALISTENHAVMEKQKRVFTVLWVSIAREVDMEKKEFLV